MICEFLGEFGENSNHWIAETVELMDKFNIGWAIWPYKKMGSVSGALAFKEPDNWTAMSTYINGGAKPSSVEGQAILDEMVENVKLSNCSINQGYLRALFPKYTQETKPFKYITLPGKMAAAHYDEGKNGESYGDDVFRTTQFGVGGGDYTAWNSGWFFRNDGVDVQLSEEEQTAVVGWTNDYEWMNYTITVVESGNYLVKIRVAGYGGAMSILVDGNTVLDNVTINSTNGWNNWETLDLGYVTLSEGTHTIKVTIDDSGYNINYFDFIDPLISGVATYETTLSVVFPTVFQNQTNINVSTFIKTPLLIKVVDVSGKEVFSANDLSTNNEIKFGADLAPGMYMVHLVYDQKTEVVKVIKGY